MRPQWIDTFYSFTPTATSEASGYPITRVASYTTHPLIRTWRSTVTTQTDIICNVGGAIAVRRIVLLNTNFTSITIARSTDNVTYSTANADSTSPALDPADGMYKSMCNLTNLARQYYRIRINTQTPVDGASYFSCGAILLLPILNTFPRDIIAPMRQGLVKIIQQSGDQILETGEQYMTQEFGGVFGNRETDQLYTLSRLGRADPFFWNENDDNNPQRMYIMRNETDLSYERHGFHLSVNPTFRAWY